MLLKHGFGTLNTLVPGHYARNINREFFHNVGKETKINNVGATLSTRDNKLYMQLQKLDVSITIIIQLMAQHFTTFDLFIPLIHGLVLKHSSIHILTVKPHQNIVPYFS